MVSLVFVRLLYNRYKLTLLKMRLCRVQINESRPKKEKKELNDSSELLRESSGKKRVLDMWKEWSLCENVDLDKMLWLLKGR